jgi:hypothetical protein
MFLNVLVRGLWLNPIPCRLVGSRLLTRYVVGRRFGLITTADLEHAAVLAAAHPAQR